jgi:hypothetical protein
LENRITSQIDHKEVIFRAQHKGSLGAYGRKVTRDVGIPHFGYWSFPTLLGFELRRPQV